MKPITSQLHPQCYPSDLSQCYDYFFAQLPRDSKFLENPLLGIVTPHIDFRVDLKGYGIAFHPLLTQPLPQLYLILGVGHRSHLEWNLDHRDYTTPFGTAICDQLALNRLATDLPADCFFEPNAHKGEHSIEFTLLWLQFLSQIQAKNTGQKQPVYFLPLLCGNFHSWMSGQVRWENLTNFHLIVAGLKRLFQEYPPGEKLQLIVSIDGCHMGSRFDHPFAVNRALLKNTQEWEEELWHQASLGDARSFAEWIREQGNWRYFDGVGALILLLAAGEGKFQLQRTYYRQWFTPDDASVVTFSSALICQKTTSSVTSR